MEIDGKEVAGMDELFTVEEVMARLKVTRATLYRLCKRGVIPSVKMGGARRFIGKQVEKAIRDMQSREIQNEMRAGAKVREY